MASARLAVGPRVRGASMHDAQVVDELDIALLAVELGAETLGEGLDGVHGVELLV